jgi:hypothetical protein
MTAVWHAIGDFFTALHPLFRALGRGGNIFFSLSIAVLVFYWCSVLLKNPDKIRTNKIEDQP